MTSRFEAVALVTHLHWDHVQGLPFFSPVLRPGSRLEVYSPPPGCGMTLTQAFHQSMRPPYFPVDLSTCGARSASARSARGTSRSATS